MKYNEWLDEWLNLYVKPSKKHSTYLRYESSLRLYIRPKLGDCDMNELNGRELQRVIIELFEKGHAYRGNGLKASTIGNIVGIVQSSLLQAVKSKVMDKQCADEICKPKSEAAALQVKCFTEKEQKTIEEAVLHDKNKCMLGIIITLYIGLRIGELFALTWEDVDIKRGVLTVNKTCRDGWGGGYKKLIGTPKTQSSNRTIPIPKQIIPYFIALKKGNESAYVISNSGNEISVRSYQRTFTRLLTRVNVRHLGFHALRHTFATRAIECGMDVKTLSEILGHKNSTITLNRYTHSLLEHKTAMMNKLGKLFD